MEKFYLGLDVGTDSVGIACTDESYNLLRAKGKDAWAVRLFDTAKTAVDRRMKRATRRRLQRRNERIRLTQELFAPHMQDELFFLRLHNSGFVYEDKDEKLQSPYALFADKMYTDKEFYKEFPTVYHLRRALADGNRKYDLRLYYLAVHHIVKYRGHFLFEGQEIGEIRDVRKLFERVNAIGAQIFEEQILRLSPENGEKCKEILLSGKSLNEKEKECCALFAADTKAAKEAVKLIVGKKGSAAVLFGNDAYKSEKTFSFKETDDITFAAWEEIYGDDFAYLAALKSLYDYIVFERVLSGCESVSESMVRLYEKHKSDLRKLKSLLTEDFSHEVYVKVFKSVNEKGNYASYVRHTKAGKKKVNVPKCSEEELYKYLKSVLSGGEISDKNQQIYNGIMADIEAGTFLPKILHADNGRIPEQVNFAELHRILVNLVRDYPAFGQADANGLSAADKIEKIFLFKIPYYVGPLNTYHEAAGGNSWAVRLQEGIITPWNFDDKIDKSASNEKFMRRMTNRCTYLHNEYVLPRCSLLYQKYDVLNRLNKIRICEQPISVALKQELYNALFLTKKRVTDNDIRNYLIQKGYFPAQERATITVSGKDGDGQAGMTSYIVFKNILGDFADTHGDVCEDIILWHTLNTDKNIVEKLILDRYGNFPEIAQHIKQLKGITAFKDFGKLSRKFLCELRGGIDFTTGAVCSVLDLLYETNQNLNEILYDEKFGFLQLIQEENGENDTEITAETLRDRGLSPSVRRGVWQALQMADEYISALHRKPDKIFVEVTRSDEKKNDGKGLRTVSRREMLLALYKDAKDVSRLVQELNRKTDSDLRQERLYLYFRQLGQCAYTGKTIELEQLSGEMYDVDHIVPQSLTKDDSIDNKVLVLRECNARKSDTYPLPDSLRNKKLWDDLHDRKLMSDKKYALLTRTEPLHTEDFTQFINRQIVVTGQTAKAVAELLHKKYGAFGTKIVYSKAQNVSEFRHKYNLYKCRETNDLHHARDAYLNIAVGNVYDTKFSNVRSYFYEKKSDGTQRQYNLKTLFDKPVAGAWDPQTSLDIVRKTLAKNSMAVTRYAYIGTGNFYDETIYKKGDGGIAAPRKMQAPYTNTERYGGFKSLTTAYFLAVQSKGKKGETVKTLERIPVLTDCAEKTSPDAVMRYLTEQAGLVDPQIVSGKIKVKSSVSVNGTPVWLAGVTGVKIVVHNAVQWFTDAQTDRYVKALVKLAEWKKSGKLTEEETKQTEFCMHANRLHGVLLSVNAQNNVALYEKITEQLRLPLYGGISGMRNFCRTVEKRAEKFRLLSVWEQAQVLLQLVKFLKCNAECANLTLLGEGATCGKLTIHKNISDMALETVNVSPCGLTVRRRKI